MQNKSMQCNGLRGSRQILILLAGLSLGGCLGEKIDLPPVTVTYPIGQGIRLGPSTADIKAGTPLLGYTLVNGLTCNLPSEEILLEAARKQVGDVLGGMISIDRIKADAITITARQGNFRTLTAAFLGLVSVGAKGVVPVPLGVALSPEGWDATIEVIPQWDVDLLPMIKNQPGCSAAVVMINGTMPANDIVVDAQIQVTVYLQAGLF